MLLSYPEAARLFADLKTVIVDEVHAFAPNQAWRPAQCVAGTVADIRAGVAPGCPVGDGFEYRSYRRWLAPGGRGDQVELVHGDPGAEPNVAILLPAGPIPWSGHAGSYAVPQVMAEIETHRTTLIFCNTRALAELIFQQLWNANEMKLPIAIHHGSLSLEARRKTEQAMADGKLRALVATASLDLGVDWGDVDLVIQMGAPKGSSRMLQRIGRANHRLDESSEAVIVPGNRFEYLEARAALDAIHEGELDPDGFREGALDVLAQHIMGCACAGPFHATQLLEEIRVAAPYAGLGEATFDRVLSFISTGGYALKAYDRFRRSSAILMAAGD